MELIAASIAGAVVTFGFMHLTYPTKRERRDLEREYVRGHVDGYLKCEQDQTEEKSWAR
jgi:hypothetical protein